MNNKKISLMSPMTPSSSLLYRLEVLFLKEKMKRFKNRFLCFLQTKERYCFHSFFQESEIVKEIFPKVWNHIFRGLHRVP
jgi:hypothetical protein